MPIAPGTNICVLNPAANAIEICGTSEFLNASSLIGRSTPVVPRIDKPPTIPSVGLSVFFASSIPSGIDIVISRSDSSNSSATLLISSRGFGLIAGSPTGICKPDLVTIPIPSPALKTIPEFFSSRRILIKIETPFVISGSSPENFLTSTKIPSSTSEIFSIGMFNRVPSSAWISTESTRSPRKKNKAALTPAAEHAPVV